MRFVAVGGAVNWRESLQCEGCGLINRWRLALHVFQLLGLPALTRPIYLTERLTPLYQAFVDRFASVIGSEYLDPAMPGGTEVERHGTSIRHEDVTQLSMLDKSVVAIGSFDVLEHVPAYRPALAEFHRVLQPGGTLVMSVPMNLGVLETVTRATIEPDGSIRHLLEAQYHGDPVRPDEGVLCFHDFGWDLLEQIRAAGFEQAEMWTIWAPEFGYLGSSQPFLLARKSL